MEKIRGTIIQIINIINWVIIPISYVLLLVLMHWQIVLTAIGLAIVTPLAFGIILAPMVWLFRRAKKRAHPYSKFFFLIYNLTFNVLVVFWGLLILDTASKFLDGINNIPLLFLSFSVVLSPLLRLEKENGKQTAEMNILPDTIFHFSTAYLILIIMFYLYGVSSYQTSIWLYYAIMAINFFSITNRFYSRVCE